MKNLYKIAISAVYLAVLFFALPLTPHNMLVWFGIFAALLFVAAYSLLAGGNIKTSISIVFIFSLALPLAILISIGLPVYQTVFASVKSIFKSDAFVELFFPFLAALTFGIIIGKVRPNPSFKRDYLR